MSVYKNNKIEICRLITIEEKEQMSELREGLIVEKKFNGGFDYLISIQKTWIKRNKHTSS